MTKEEIAEIETYARRVIEAKRRGMKFPFLEAKERLVRIMGTFDLATGHADTMDELLDSLESELRDVLGYYRAALKIKEDEPVGNTAPEPEVKREPLSDEDIILENLNYYPAYASFYDGVRWAEEYHGIGGEDE